MTMVPAILPGAEPVFFRPDVRIFPVSGRRTGRVAEDLPKPKSTPEKINEREPRPDADEAKTDKSYPFPVWSGLLTRKHRKAIGIAVWFFLWLLDRVTRDENGWGIVLGGKPVKDEEVALELGVHINTVRSDRVTLCDGKYIQCTRTPYGFSYRVRNSRKFGIWGKKRPTETCGSQDRDQQGPVAPDRQVPVETKKTMQLVHAVKPKPSEGRFEIFWNEYPRKDAKKEAERAWRKIPLCEHQVILAAVRVRMQTEQWLKDSGKFIPYAATFLNKERWKDLLPGHTEQPELIPGRIPTVRDIRPKER